MKSFQRVAEKKLHCGYSENLNNIYCWQFVTPTMGLNPEKISPCWLNGEFHGPVLWPGSKDLRYLSSHKASLLYMIISEF